jgi:protein-L-isoaspartate(D-aspartate) O-methyltransferase
MNSNAEKFQQQLLVQAQRIYNKNPITEATQKAFMAVPRHLFVKHYREFGTQDWIEVNENNLESHLATIYRDGTLLLFGGENDDIVSTISQPSFVLHMLDLLQLKPGHKVFELGTGSGWNAALMAHLVGPEGHVYSLEIIPAVAQTAKENIEHAGIKNVSVIEADAGEGYAPGAPFDRVIFTAGTYDLPHQLFHQTKDGGLLLMIIKNRGGGDVLFLLRKNGDHFESLESEICFFVQMTGKYRVTDLDPIDLKSIPEWPGLEQQAVSTRKFWWGSKSQFSMKTYPIRSFLTITEPNFKTFKTEKTEEQYFGLLDRNNNSLVIAKDDKFISFGNLAAEEKLMEDIRTWIKLGMPSAVCFNLKIYPKELSLSMNENQWVVKRSESQFLWSLSI